MKRKTIFTFLPCFLILARNSCKIFSKSGESGHPYLLSDFRVLFIMITIHRDCCVNYGIFTDVLFAD